MRGWHRTRCRLHRCRARHSCGRRLLPPAHLGHRLLRLAWRGWKKDRFFFNFDLSQHESQVRPRSLEKWKMISWTEDLVEPTLDF